MSSSVSRFAHRPQLTSDRPATATTSDPRGRPLQRWVLASALLAPIALVGAWLVAGLVQPPGYSPVSQSISALAAYSASDRWIMTAGIYLVGVCQLVTAAGLTRLRTGPRLFLAAGGVTGLGVAYFPQPEYGSTTASPHIIFATLSVVCLAVWPAVIGPLGLPRAAVLGGRSVVAVTILFLGLLAWLYVAGHGGGGLGIAERVDTAVANLWPVVIVVALIRTERPVFAPGQAAGALA